MANFHKNVLDKILDSVSDGISKQFKGVQEINKKFSFLWTYLQLTDTELSEKRNSFTSVYDDVSKDELLEEAFAQKVNILSPKYPKFRARSRA